MGMEDRDWYREKRIDWDRGGLKDRKGKKRGPRPLFWWIAAVLAGIIAAWFLIAPGS